MNATERGRNDLLEFERSQPTNYWLEDAHAQRVARFYAGDRYDQWVEGFRRWGAEAAGPVDRAVRQNDLPHNLPRLERWSPYGERIEEVEFHPTYHDAGRAIYGSGAMAALAEWGANVRSLTLFYISAHNGEAGHNCPLACTAGLIKALRAVGGEELQQRYLPRLTDTRYNELAHGAQFLTEVQGGSDVGANTVRATPDAASGTWRIHGEKWFCSNATADLILMTARPERAPGGTKGLGLFLVPRRLPGGALNAYAIRRLKEKIGTRTMASGEIDFNGAVAWAVGPVDDGFANTMTYVINTSRLVNAFGCAGHARRAYLVAQAYARKRRAFGKVIGELAMVQETLADMRSEVLAMVSGAYHLAQLMDLDETGQLDETGRAALRVALNLNKTRNAISAHEVISSGIEVLGGNGAIETFSVLPRLLRDNVVFENWEGTHNVLLTQVWNDCRRKGFHEPFIAHVEALARGQARLSAEAHALARELREVIAADDPVGPLRMRQVGARAAWLFWAASMHHDGTPADLIEHFADRRLGPAAARDEAYARRLTALAFEAPPR